MTRTDLPAWATEIDPQPDWTVTKERSDGGWIVEARWWGWLGNGQTRGRNAVLIRLGDDADASAEYRGVTSGVMRRLERHLGDMSVEMHPQLTTGAYQFMVRNYVAGRVAELPAGPREGGDAYYAGLLAIYEDLLAKGNPEPLNVLARALELPKETVKTRIRVARRRRDP